MSDENLNDVEQGDSVQSAAATEQSSTAGKAPGCKQGKRRKAIAAGIAAVAVVACIGAGVAVASQQPQTVDGAQSEQAAGQNGAAATASTLEAAITAENWTDDSSAFIAHVYGTDSDGNAVDTYHAFTASGGKDMAIAQGSYTLEWVPAINSDGSIYRTPEATSLEATSGAVKADQAFEQVPADQVTADDLNAILDKVTAAVEKGDSSLSGDAGKTVVDKAVSNASANANADKEAVEAKKQVADSVAAAKAEGKDASAAKQEAQQKAPASVTQTSGTETVSANSSSNSVTSSTGESSPSGSSGSSEQSHQHTWVAQTEHHNAQYETVHHNAVYKDVQVCSDCGAINPSDSHIYEHMLASEDAYGGTYGKRIKVQDAYDEKVLVKAAYDETTYHCSTCGATK